METITPGSTCRHSSIHVTSRHQTEFIDLTDRLTRLVANTGLRFGVVNVQTLHTSTAVVIDEQEPLPLVHAYSRALLLPSSACLNVTNGRILLGRTQRVFLIELDGPRDRDLSVLIFGEAGE